MPNLSQFESLPGKMEKSQNPAETEAPIEELSQDLKRIALQNNVLCSFCQESCDGPSKTGEPYRLRPLSELLETAKSCHYCALWVQSLESSAQATTQEGEEMSILLHPLTQKGDKPEDVILQYTEMHDIFEGGTRQHLSWPHLGTIWACLDLLPAKGKPADISRWV